MCAAQLHIISSLSTTLFEKLKVNKSICSKTTVILAHTKVLCVHCSVLCVEFKVQMLTVGLETTTL